MVTYTASALLHVSTMWTSETRATMPHTVCLFEQVDCFDFNSCVW